MEWDFISYIFYSVYRILLFRKSKNGIFMKNNKYMDVQSLLLLTDFLSEITTSASNSRILCGYDLHSSVER